MGGAGGCSRLGAVLSTYDSARSPSPTHKGLEMRFFFLQVYLDFRESESSPGPA